MQPHKIFKHHNQTKHLFYLKQDDLLEPHDILTEILTLTSKSPYVFIKLQLYMIHIKIPHQPEKALSYYHCLNLYDLVKEHGPLTEHQSLNLIRQIIILFCECKQYNLFLQIISRSNIFINLSNFNVKLCIPNALLPFTTKVSFTDFSCSTYYLPPEWISRKSYYADACSTWNLGILLFYMLYNKMPFYSHWQIVHSPVILSNHYSVTLDAQLFIGWCLSKNFLERITLQQCKHHPWITQKMI